MNKIFCITIPVILLLTWSCTSKQTYSDSRFLLSGPGWQIRSSAVFSDSGNIVSSPGYSTEGWTPARVPTTVLRTLVADSVYPDPWTGLNNFRIPDASDEFNRKWNLARFSHLGENVNPWKDPWWFRKEFVLPAVYKGRKLWLNFDGINYRADVWINGHKIADRREMAGMFLRFRYDISDFALPGKKNCLAVMIHQVDHPGLPDPGVQFEVFGKTRGHAKDIFRDETLKFSGGWDCAPVIRDRNMGIYEDVFVEASGEVTVEDPFIKTTLPLPDTTMADLDISTILKNSSNRKVSGELQVRVSLIKDIEFPAYTRHMEGEMKDILITKKITIEPSCSLHVSLGPGEFPELSVTNPLLWWPNGYGKQYLHSLVITFSEDGKVSDEKKVTFGIRQVTNELKKIGEDYGRVFLINGRKVFCRGGWLQPDAMLDYGTKRIYDEARLLAMANVNMIASEDAPAPPEEVLESYDKYGLMYWETFYQCYRMYPGDVSANNPDDHLLALREARDIIKRYRNHPSLVLWCAANEVTVAKDIYDPLREYIVELDGTRPFIPTSSISWDVDRLTPYIKTDMPVGTTDDGDPDYNWNPEKFYFDKILEVRLQTFRNELGVASVPEFSSIRKFIPKLSTNVSDKLFPLDSTWAEHGAWDDNNYAFRSYDNAIRSIYGPPSDAEDYVRKAQYVNANSYRAMFEAANHRMWTITSGVMLWKLNDCWPSVLWQLYDWYLCQNAAYFYSQDAMEPLHIQLNAGNPVVSVINNLKHAPGRVVAEAKVTDFRMKDIWTRSDTVTIDSSGYFELFTLPQDLNTTPVYFVRLKLKGTDGREISTNTYWLSKNASPDFSELARLEKISPEVNISCEMKGKELHFTITLSNKTGKLSFFNRVAITRGETGAEILPTFWESNYITLFPGESRIVRAIIAKEDLKDDVPWFRVENNGSFRPVPVKININ